MENIINALPLEFKVRQKLLNNTQKTVNKKVFSSYIENDMCFENA